MLKNGLVQVMDEQNQEGQTALMIGAMRGHAAAVNHMIGYGVNANLQDLVSLNRYHS